MDPAAPTLAPATGDVALACPLIMEALAGAAEAPVVPANPIVITANMAMRVARIVFSHWYVAFYVARRPR
jgi:hypothetical protein